MDYTCFSEKGAESLPSNQVIEEYLLKGIKPIIFLDSCVCLHIIKVVDYGKKAKNVDLSRVIELKQYLEEHQGIDINPFFGFLELCSRDGQFDLIKFQDFLHRIDFFKKIKLRQFKSMKFDFQRSYFSLNNTPSQLNNPLKALDPSLKNTYCALLKIRSLAMLDLSKKSAEQNICDLLDWMADELDMIRAAEYKLALNIFGGNTEFRKMIGLDCRLSEVKKKLIGTSWDIFHAKHTSNSFRLSQLLRQNIYPFFITSDANLFNIFKKFSLTVINDGGDDFMTSFLMNSDFNFPHFNKSFIHKQNDRMINLFIDRRDQIYCFDKTKINNLIELLEIENGFDA